MQIVGNHFYIDVEPELFLNIDETSKSVRIGPTESHFYFLYNFCFDIEIKQNKKLKNYYDVRIVKDNNQALKIDVDFYFKEEEKEQVDKIINKMKELSEKSKEMIL